VRRGVPGALVLLLVAALLPATGAMATGTHRGTAVARAADVVTESAHSGSHYGAVNTASDGGSVYQDVALNTTAGQTICASADVRSQIPNAGAKGTFALFLFGGAATDSGSRAFSNLGTGTHWSQVQACVEATGSHSTLRVQLYPTPGGETVDMDDVDVHGSLAVNGSFENGGGPWTVYPGTSTNYVTYAASGSQPAYSGSHFGATNTASDGGSIYQDVALNTTAGQTICGSARVRTEGSAKGASGTFALFLFGGAATDSGGAAFSGLGNGNNWSLEQTCVEATGSHTTLRIQLYPTPGGPTVDVDDVDVHESGAANAGFESGSGPWSPYPGTNSNYVDYNGQGHSGAYYGATNTSGTGGGIYEDVALNTTAGETICGTAQVRTEGSATGAHGALALWLIGGAAADGGSSNYSGLGNGSNWSPVSTCVEAAGSHTTLRVQLYPAIGSPTVEIDDVDVHGSAAVNGGFENGPGPWAIYPGTDTNYVDYASGQLKVTVTPPITVMPVVTTPTTTTLPVPRSKRALHIKLALGWTWNHAVTRLRKYKLGRFPGGTQLTFKCSGQGCPRQATASAKGGRRMRKLLKSLLGRRFRAGDVIAITFTARHWQAERAKVVVRKGRLPRVRAG
jgi:hypothetical protein